MHLERLDHRIALELSNNNVDSSLIGLIASDQVQRQPALDADCLAMEVIVPSQGTNAIGSMVLPGDHSLAGCISHWEV